jgi:hypothetical protein
LEQGLFLALMDLGRDDESAACPSRELDGEVDALLSSDASDEEEIVTGAPADRRRREVDAVVDRREPVRIRFQRRWLSLIATSGIDGIASMYCVAPATSRRPWSVVTTGTGACCANRKPCVSTWEWMMSNRSASSHARATAIWK